MHCGHGPAPHRRWTQVGNAYGRGPRAQAPGLGDGLADWRKHSRSGQHKWFLSTEDNRPSVRHPLSDLGSSEQEKSPLECFLILIALVKSQNKATLNWAVLFCTLTPGQAWPTFMPPLLHPAPGRHRWQITAHLPAKQKHTSITLSTLFSKRPLPSSQS